MGTTSSNTASTPSSNLLPSSHGKAFHKAVTFDTCSPSGKPPLPHHGAQLTQCISGVDMSKQSAADRALMTKFQRSIISFINNLDPNGIPASDTWETFDSFTQRSLVFERGSAPAAVERFTVDPSVCAFINSKNLEFLR